MDELIQIFIDFIPNDKEFVESLMPKYKREFRILGTYIKEHQTSLLCTDADFMQELIDFIDGNGFEVIRPQVKDPYNDYPIELIPIYEEKTTPLKEEIEELNEKIREAVKKIESTLSEYVSTQETVLSFTSMGDCERYVLEYSKLCTPRPLWICLHRCLEFLRLVSAGWGRSAALPRPP